MYFIRPAGLVTASGRTAATAVFVELFDKLSLLCELAVLATPCRCFAVPSSPVGTVGFGGPSFDQGPVFAGVHPMSFPHSLPFQ